jgi:hypothetical protein
MTLLTLQNFYKETLATACTAGATNIYVTSLPTPATGYVVISPSSASLREIVFYTAKGSDGGGDYITVTAPNRGLGGTTDQTHALGEPARMNYTAQHQQEISDAIDAITAGGSPDASITTKGIGKLSASPNTTLGTVTVTIASPAVFSYTAHGLIAGDTLELTTTGSLPTGLAVSTKYFVISSGLTANAFQVATSLAGTAVDTSGSQSGTHTLVRTTPYFLGQNDPALPTADQAAALGGDGGTPSATNLYQTERSTRYGHRTMVAGATINGATLPVPVYQNKTDNEFYACDGDDTAAMKFLGFAISNGTDGAAIDVQFSGVVPGFTSLTEGEKYYASDTVGAIANTAGTREILVGIAISETELLIQKGRRNMNGILQQTDAGGDETTTDTVITTGFRPSVIRMGGYLDGGGAGGGQFNSSNGTWVNGVHRSVSMASDAGGRTSAVSINSILNVFSEEITHQWQISIKDITDTGFTISCLQKISNPARIDMTWEAEGEL